MKNINTVILSFAVATGILLSTGCETVPKSHDRTSAVSVSEAEKEQSELGAKAWEELKRQNPRTRNRAYTRALNRVSRNLTIKYNNEKYIDWEFIVFESATPNAFCLPGGKIAICSGLFKYIKNDAELAMVVGHEMAHALRRHISQQQRQEALKDVVALAF